MCGIAGVLSFCPGGPVIAADAVSDALQHRGPDESGVYDSGPVQLIHRRLSIIDPEHGKQPIFNEDESICIIFNGEIYNYESLRNSLSAAGHQFTTETDTEVLVHLYEEHGLSFVDELQGMFAFALWDAESEQVVLARDRAGIKPLLVAKDGDQVAFASEIQALLEMDIDHGGMDTTALTHYFGLGFIPAPRTAFSNISKLCPGELAVLSEDGVRQESYYSPTVQPHDTAFGDAADTLRDHVEQAVRKRLQSDVQLGAFLSGGIDSSIVVGVLSEYLDEPLQTFTIGFERERFDESEAARTVAEYHGTNHTEFSITAADVRDTIPAVLRNLGEPFGDQSLIPSYVIAEKTSEEVKVAHSGDGADELFAGYDRYRGEFLSRYYRLIPRAVRERAIEPAVASLPASRGSAIGEFNRKAQKFVRGGTPDPSDRHFEWMRITDSKGEAAVADGMFDSCRGLLDEHHRSTRAFLPPERCDPVGEMQAVDVRFTLPSQILQKVDAASMYNSLEVRVPFLDTDVVEYTLSLPTSYKITAHSRKRVLKAAFDEVLPAEILNRNKHGFDMPVGEWFKDELAAEFRQTVGGLETEILDIDGVMDIYGEHISGQAEHGKFLWTVYVFATWLRQMRRAGVLDEPA